LTTADVAGFEALDRARSGESGHDDARTTGKLMRASSKAAEERSEGGQLSC
jgi:hypothetical protein